MSSQETSGHVKAAIIGGVFVVIAACIGGVFLIINTLVANGFIILGPSVQAGNPNPQPTATSKVVEVAATETQGITPPTSAPVFESQSTDNAKVELLGEWLYQQPRASMPAPAGPGQAVFAHGDIDNTGTCHVKEFGPSEIVQGLGEGTFKLWLITGTPEQIRSVETQLQSGAAAHAGTSCPYLP